MFTLRSVYVEQRTLMYQLASSDLAACFFRTAANPVDATSSALVLANMRKADCQYRDCGAYLVERRTINETTCMLCLSSSPFSNYSKPIDFLTRLSIMKVGLSSMSNFHGHLSRPFNCCSRKKVRLRHSSEPTVFELILSHKADM